jgi:hypothetical protein
MASSDTTVYELPSPATACLAPKLKLPPDAEWFETMTIEESREMVPKAVLDILVEKRAAQLKSQWDVWYTNKC